MPAAQSRRVRPPAALTADATVDAVRQSTRQRPEVCGVYLFEQPDERGEWTLTVGFQLTTAAAAAAVMPAIAADLASSLPDASLRLLALSRRMLGTVRQSVRPLELPPDG